MKYKIAVLADPRIAHINPSDPDTLYLGGDLEGMTLAIREHHECVLDKRMLKYDSVEDFIIEHIETILSHDHIHNTLFYVDGKASAEMWDNVDSFNELTGTFLNPPVVGVDMRQCPDCDKPLDKVSQVHSEYKTHRWYCNSTTCPVIEVKFEQSTYAGFKVSRVTREAVPRTIPLKGTTLTEIKDNIELDNNE